MKTSHFPLLILLACSVGCAQRQSPRAAPVAQSANTGAPSKAPPTPTATTPPLAALQPSVGQPSSQPTTTATGAHGLREVLPRVRVDAHAGIVEFDGTVPIDVHNPRTPDTYLELIACTRNSKEHEALVMTDAKPSHIHAALLLAGANPGKPGAWDWSGPALVAHPPTGSIVDVSLRSVRNGEAIEEPASMWVARITDDALLPTIDTEGHWVFAGSREVVRQGKTWYEADGSGTVIGLATFGGETLGWTTMYNPDSGVAENVWIAANSAVPPFGTPVTVVLRVRR